MGRPHREQWSRTEGEEESYTLVLTQTEEEEAYHGGWTKEKQRESGAIRESTCIPAPSEETSASVTSKEIGMIR